jgi:hypothetical protein
MEAEGTPEEGKRETKFRYTGKTSCITEAMGVYFIGRSSGKVDNTIALV